jgi:hypothetical protein
MSKMLLCMVLFTSLKNVHIEDVATNYWLTQFINSHNNKMWVNSAGILANSPKSYSVTKNNILHKNTPRLGVVFPHNPVQFGGIGIGINYLIEQSNTSGIIEDNEIFVKTNAVYGLLNYDRGIGSSMPRSRIVSLGSLAHKVSLGSLVAPLAHVLRNIFFRIGGKGVLLQ